jgi:hypothetical protein
MTPAAGTDAVRDVVDDVVVTGRADTVGDVIEGSMLYLLSQPRYCADQYNTTGPRL